MSVILNDVKKNSEVSEKSSGIVNVQPTEDDYETIKLISNGAYG